MIDSTLQSIDAGWAWSPFEPTPSRPWDQRRAAQLFRRAGFGARSEQLTKAVAASPAETVHSLVSGSEDGPFVTQMNQMMRTLVSGNDPHSLTAGWLYRMLHTPHPLLEKMTLFWHGHFATSGAKVQNATLMLNQNDLLRENALGNFGQLVQAISRNPAMLLYLDSATNRKSHPNENFARELLELFCLGLGNYSEKDIQELARCFTGWEVNLGQFRFNRFQADTGSKSIFNQSSTFNGDDGIRIVLEQPATTRFVVGKLLRFFVADADFPPALIQPLADQLRKDDLNVAGIVERILGSQLFFSEIVEGKKVRSPVDVGIGVLTSLEATTNVNRLSEELAQLGQSVFFPPNVKGWDGGKTWINSATILGRGNLVRRLVNSPEARFGGLKLSEYLSSRGINSAEGGVDWLLDLLIAVPVPPSSKGRLLDLAKNGNNWGDVIHAVAVLPEFHLC